MEAVTPHDLFELIVEYGMALVFGVAVVVLVAIFLIAIVVGMFSG